MITNTIRSFWNRARRMIFKTCMNREIYNLIFPHLEGEADCGYPFTTATEMNALTEALNAKSLLAKLEEQISRMPKAYGESYRYIMHRDLRRRLSKYEEMAERLSRPRQIDPRFIARPI